MLGDIWTVIWKEWREILHQRGSIRATVLGQFWLVIFVALYFSLQAGREWLETAASLQLWCLLPMMLVITIIPDSFAGERERHTLETLLASRLSEPAIVLGKIGAAVSYGCGLTLLASLVSMVTANMMNWNGTLRFYPVGVFLAGIGASLLTATLAASLGVLISLRAATVRQAQQSLGLAIAFFIIIVLVTVLLIELSFGLFLLPGDWQASATTLKAASSTEVVLIGVLLLILLDLSLIAIAIRRFKRTRLILD